MKISKNGEILIEADVTDSLFGKIKGLMFEEVEKCEGLLMVFDDSRFRDIWMAFVPQDLSIIFIDENKQVVDKTLARKLTLNPGTWKTYGPSEACKYILECHASKINDFEIGDSLEWEINNG